MRAEIRQKLDDLRDLSAAVDALSLRHPGDDADFPSDYMRVCMDDMIPALLRQAPELVRAKMTEHLEQCAKETIQEIRRFLREDAIL